jgi:iron(III) transport system ATP-binding protein
VGCQVIELSGVTKRFDGVVAVNAFDLRIQRGARAAVLGPSGCGKTTLLRLIAGLELPDSGRVMIAGDEVSAPGRAAAPHTRGIGFVFQDAALFPHMSVAENVAYGLDGPKEEVRSRVADLLAAAGLEDMGSRRPGSLSGGQQRRVALARALAPAPARLLLDEPFTNLDGEARGELLRLADRLVAAGGATLLLVTHDRGEAEALCCDVVRMEAGRRVG